MRSNEYNEIHLGSSYLLAEHQYHQQQMRQAAALGMHLSLRCPEAVRPGSRPGGSRRVEERITRPPISGRAKRTRPPERRKGAGCVLSFSFSPGGPGGGGGGGGGPGGP
jgi:hypothetical protein